MVRTQFWMKSVLLVISILAIANTLHAAVVQTTSLAPFGELDAALKAQDPIESLFIDGSMVELTRNDNTLDVIVNARGLTPSAVYTVWWVFFNHPQYCEQLCDPGPDLQSPDVAVSAIYATGGVASAEGTATFAATVSTGEFPENPDKVFLDSSNGSGLNDTMEAEVHIVLRGHGAPIEGMVDLQTTTVNGGCPPHECVNEFAAIFYPDASATPVQPHKKLTMTWGRIKKDQ